MALHALVHYQYVGDVVVRSLQEDRGGFLRVWLRVRRAIPGWLRAKDAQLLYSLAHHGPGQGAIVEIGSAWGKSTVLLAQGSKAARREHVYAIDPHTGDPWYLDDAQLSQFSSLEAFHHNISRFGASDWIEPIVATSVDAAQRADIGPIRLLYIDGLHTYEGVRADIDLWVPRVVPGGVIVFDDYYNDRPGVGVRQAVDELLATGQVGPLQRAQVLVWTTKQT